MEGVEEGGKVVVVALAGSTCCGKTTIAGHLPSELERTFRLRVETVVIHQDDYYIDGCDGGWDEAESIDSASIVRDVTATIRRASIAQSRDGAVAAHGDQGVLVDGETTVLVARSCPSASASAMSASVPDSASAVSPTFPACATPESASEDAVRARDRSIDGVRLGSSSTAGAVRGRGGGGLSDAITVIIVEGFLAHRFMSTLLPPALEIERHSANPTGCDAGPGQRSWILSMREIARESQAPARPCSVSLVIARVTVPVDIARARRAARTAPPGDPEWVPEPEGYFDTVAWPAHRKYEAEFDASDVGVDIEIDGTRDPRESAGLLARMVSERV